MGNCNPGKGSIPKKRKCEMNIIPNTPNKSNQQLYAKIVLIGNSGVGKTSIA